MSTFFENYAALCAARGETPNAVARRLSIPSGSITAWKNGAEPRQSTIQRIAAHFGVSTDCLLGQEGAGSVRDLLDEVDVAFYGEFRELDPEQQETVRDMVHLMRQRRSKE